MLIVGSPYLFYLVPIANQDIITKLRLGYTTIRKMFNKWTKHDIFNLAYFKLLNDSQFNISKIRNNNDIDLFIDAFFVNNKTGVEWLMLILFITKNM